MAEAGFHSIQKHNLHQLKKKMEGCRVSDQRPWSGSGEAGFSERILMEGLRCLCCHHVRGGLGGLSREETGF